jgi:hypothetical protein
MGKRTTPPTRPTRTKSVHRAAGGQRLDALPDTLDFRDLMFTPTLVEVPATIPLKKYREVKAPILDQGQEGACTGFGLATVANFLLRSRRDTPDAVGVSPRMLYEMAKRYDEWPGEDYPGSSARGAMKGWYKHGVCAEKDWPYEAVAASAGRLDNTRATAARLRPLGAYYRVNHRDLVAMHSAIAETRILYATSLVHRGWDKVKGDGIIPFSKASNGAHAFAIVAYDSEGLWVQNSWGEDWGLDGFCRISYDDWLVNGTDVWVARLGAPVSLRREESQAVSVAASSAKSATYAFSDLRPHIISIGNDRLLREGGTFGTTRADVQHIFEVDFPRLKAKHKIKHLLLYAHGGLTGEDSAVQRLADVRPALLDKGVYPLSFIWKTDFWSTVTNIVKDALRRRRPEGILDDAKDFMLDRLDDALEPLARTIGGKLLWDEMKENALESTRSERGGARFTLAQVDALLGRHQDLKVHAAGHSAGSIFLAPLLQSLTARDQHARDVASLTLWAPAATVDLFKECYLPALRARWIKRFALFTLDDKAERDDHCAETYHKSLLYLVSHAFEARPRIPLIRPGVPIVGMEKFVKDDRDLQALFQQKKRAWWVRSPNTVEDGQPGASRARRHGDFDDDSATLRALLATILDESSDPATFVFHRSASSCAAARKRLG